MKISTQGISIVNFKDDKLKALIQYCHACKHAQPHAEAHKRTKISIWIPTVLLCIPKS